MENDPWAAFRVNNGGGVPPPVTVEKPTVDSSQKTAGDDPWAAFRATEEAKPSEHKFGLGDTWPARLAKSIYSAVTLPHDVMTGEAHVPGSPEAQAIPGAVPFGSPDSSGERIADLAMFGPGSVANRTGSSLVQAVGPKPPSAAPSVEELKDAYRAVRNDPNVANAIVPMQQIGDLSTAAQNDLVKQGFRPTTASAADTFGELGNLTPKPPPAPSAAERLQAEMNWEKPPEPPPQPTTATIDDVLAARRAFGQTAKQKNPFPIGGATPDAAASQQVISKIDDLIEQHAPEMIEANKNISAAKTAEAIDNRVMKADLGAAATNSGMNIGNKIRQQAVQILTNPAARRGLQPEEIDMLTSLVRGNPTRNTLRRVANMLGGGGGLGAEVTGDVASRTLGPVGWIMSPIGHVLKHVENSLTVKAANQISEAIRMRSPLGQAIQSSSDKWTAARDSFLQGPSAAKFAAHMIASRNLANTLAGAGAKIDPMQLIRSVQGASPANAQDEKL